MQLSIFCLYLVVQTNLAIQRKLHPQLQYLHVLGYVCGHLPLRTLRKNFFFRPEILWSHLSDF